MLSSSAGRDASSGVGAPVYTRHRPERTVLYRLVQEYYPELRAHLAARGTALPGYVEQEFEKYLESVERNDSYLTGYSGTRGRNRSRVRAGPIVNSAPLSSSALICRNAWMTVSPMMAGLTSSERT